MHKNLKTRVKLLRDLLTYYRSPGAIIINAQSKVEPVEATSKWCFFIQGPVSLLKKHELEQLRRAYPESQIVFSTWYEENVEKEFFDRLSISLILNKKPQFSGIMNSNYQLVQINNGLKLLDREEIDYIVKLRIDALPRYPHQMVPYFKKLDQSYPNRIWGADINTKIDIPFSLSDICMWSNTDNFYNYWEAPELTSCDISPKQYIKDSKGFTDSNFIAEFKPAEAHYCFSWMLAKSNSAIPFSLKAWKEALSKEVGVFNSLHIGLYFNKYSHLHSVYGQKEMKYLGFEHWLCLQY